jgi:hypothetical protein
VFHILKKCEWRQNVVQIENCIIKCIILQLCNCENCFCNIWIRIYFIGNIWCYLCWVGEVPLNNIPCHFCFQQNVTIYWKRLGGTEEDNFEKPVSIASLEIWFPDFPNVGQILSLCASWPGNTDSAEDASDRWNCYIRCRGMKGWQGRGCMYSLCIIISLHHQSMEEVWNFLLAFLYLMVCVYIITWARLCLLLCFSMKSKWRTNFI